MMGLKKAQRTGLGSSADIEDKTTTKRKGIKRRIYI